MGYAHPEPTTPPPFIGRQEELGTLADLLMRPDCRLITLMGTGGIGKTRLAIEVSAQISLPNDVYFVPLQPLTSPDLIVPAIAEALKVNFYGENPPRVQLLDYLREKHLLLVLDNLEQLLDGADLLSEILATAPHVKILITSRDDTDHHQP